MARRFVPVSDPEKARCEQDEESLRKHRQFDTPFSLLPSDLNKKRRTGKEDLGPLGRKDEELEQDEHGLWRKKAALFDKPQTWGREAVEYSNPEEARVDGNTGPKWGRPGTVGWGVQGRFGGRDNDVGLAVLQRGEVNQVMVKNEKGLWVQKKADKEDEDGEPVVTKTHWRCAGCGAETSRTMEFCRKYECNGRRPAVAADVPASLRASNPNEDPRLEAAKQKGRGTKDAAQQALKALEERRRKGQQEKEKLGLMRRPTGGADDRGRKGGGKITTLNSSSHQVRPARRVKHNEKWQGVQMSDADAKKIAGKAVGGQSADPEKGLRRIEDSERSILRKAAEPKRDGVDVAADVARALSRSRSRSPGGDSEESGDGARPAWASPSRSRSRSPVAATSVSGGGGGDVVVDFF